MGLNRNLGNLTEIIKENSGNIGIGLSPISGYKFDVSGSGRFSGSISASSLIIPGGTSSQILAADGSVITAGTGISITGGTISSTVTGGVTSFNTRTGGITLSSGDVTTALGYTPYNSTNPNGYISSYTETDPTVPSHVKSITTTEKSNWNTAFGWGNHASAGYVPQARTITINGTAYDLTSNRSWTVSGTVTSGVSITSAGSANNAPSTPSVNIGMYVGTYAFIDLSTADTNGSWIDFSKANGTDYGGRIRYNNGSDYFSISAGATEQVRIFNTNAEAMGSFRSPLFYDSNNTGYYLDPASSSNFATIQTAGLLVGYGQSYSSVDMYDGDEGTRTMHCNSNRIGFLNQAGSWGSWSQDNGNWISTTDMQSPIFYDYNNTGYYVDAASTSSLYEANFGDNSSGNQGINIYYGNQTSGYGKIRFYQSGSNHQTIHSFSANWQGGGFGSGNSANAINIDGAAGVTFGGWNVPDAYIAKGGNFWCRYDVIAYSDARVKDNVEVITNALDKISKVRGVTFTRNDYEDKEKRHTGVIAQEMLEALPEAVTKDSDGMYSVSYGNLAGLFIEAIKEQQTQIEELKQLVNKLINK